MAQTFEAIGSELRAILSDLRQRPGLGGETWCPAADAAAIARQIVDRTEELGNGFASVVRFARLAALASKHGYIEFAYQPLLRAHIFRSVTERARLLGYLPKNLVAIAPAGVRLLEPELSVAQGGEKPFEITYAQMPRYAAFLDVLHNSLGYAELADILNPLMNLDTPPTQVRDVARTLRSRFNSWLQDQVESAHRRTQAKIIHAFLAERQALAPTLIDDEIVLSFWQSRATFWQAKAGAAPGNRSADEASVELRSVEKGASDEGFRGFRSAARLVLRYRQALEDAFTEHLHDTALRFGEVGTPGEVSLEHIEADLANVHEDEERPQGSERARASTEEWVSPLDGITCQSASRVKWLTNREIKRLANYCGRTEGNPNPLADIEAGDSSSGEKGSTPGLPLMEGRPFDLRLLRTLLRTDVFGDAQAQIIALLRRREPLVQALSQVIGGLDDQAYERAADEYRRIYEQIMAEALASFHILASRGDVSALMLLDCLCSAETKAAILASLRKADNVAALWPRLAGEVGGPHDHENEEATPGSLAALKHALVNAANSVATGNEDALGEFMKAARKARSGVHREGFRNDDDTPEMHAALRSSLPAVIRLIRELQRLITSISVARFLDQVPHDRACFHQTFALIHGLGATAIPVPTNDDRRF